MNTLNEAEVTLFELRPIDGSWSDANIQRIAHEPEKNRLVVTITEAAEYALGAPNQVFFLPIVMQ
jgi:hypothetical protein